MANGCLAAALEIPFLPLALLRIPGDMTLYREADASRSPKLI